MTSDGQDNREYGWREALRRIADCKATRSTKLDLGGLALTALPEEMLDLTWLKRLFLGLSAAARRKHHYQLTELDKKMCNAVRALPDAFEDTLSHLVRLDCSYTQIADLAPLAGLSSLKSLNCSGTLVNDLGPIADLTALLSIDCSRTNVADLGPAVNLTDLQYIDCSRTNVDDLGLVVNLTDLHYIDCSRTKVADLSPIVTLTALQSLDCANTQVDDLAPLKALTDLQSLNCSRTQVDDLGPLANLPNLQSLNCSRTQVDDLGPLANLANLQSLNCANTRVDELGPLVNLANLQSVNCANTQVDDLGPLANLANLQSLNCARTRVSGLGPLANLTGLQSFYCSRTNVVELWPLATLTNLRYFNCARTKVTDCGPLAALTGLQYIDCSRTKVANLGPLANLTGLQILHCAGTKVADLAPLKALTALKTLDCSDSQVADLGPLANLTALQSLHCSQCRLNSVSEEFWHNPSLTEVRAHGTKVPGIPGEILSNVDVDNCLARLRSHFRDLAAGSETVHDVKLMILGNGNIGKTQICRRLTDESYDETVRTTHGIQISSCALPGILAKDDAKQYRRLRIWDFGGQDIYLGTHALFMNSRAIFPIVWTTNSQREPFHSHDDKRFPNFPLAYWIDYVRSFGDPDSPLLIIQNQCDTPGQEALTPPVSDDALGAFAFRKPVHYSAKYDLGRAALNEALVQAADWILKQRGPDFIGIGRARVKSTLEEMRDRDAEKDPHDRENQILSYDQFHELCDETGGVADPDALLHYLHTIGTVFHSRDLFSGSIILDQQWALNAIYTLFDRDRCYYILTQGGGKFTPSLLAKLVWNEEGYDSDAQLLFISMMQSCSMCFRLRSGSEDGRVEPEYIAPDLLPETASFAATMWDEDNDGGEESFEFDLLPPGLMRAIISRIGESAGLTADYWKNGILLYEAETGSRGRIEQGFGKKWSGEIRIRTQKGRYDKLLRMLTKIVNEEQQKFGFPAKQETEAADKHETPRYGEEPTKSPKLYVSYAWGDATEAGQARDEAVEKLCHIAGEKGFEILRDKDQMQYGDRISKFMHKLAQGDRIFVILSEKYLRSSFCMRELYDIWCNCRQDDKEFLGKIRVFRLPDANISSTVDRAHWIQHWGAEYDKLDALIGNTVLKRIPPKDLEHFQHLERFANHIGEILLLIADTLRPKGFEDSEEYWFKDL